MQMKVDAAEREAVSGHLDDARKELLSASYIDPSNTVVRERLKELIAAEPGRLRGTSTEADSRTPRNSPFKPERETSIIEAIRRAPTKNWPASSGWTLPSMSTFAPARCASAWTTWTF